MDGLIINLVTFAIGAIAGFGFGAFFYNNNAKKMKEAIDTINNLKDQLKKKKRR